MSRFDLHPIVAALHEAGVRSVIVGGVAVAAHGFIRATEDLDVVPDPERGNLPALANVLVELGATLPTAGGRPFEPRDLRIGVNVTADTPSGGVDILQRVAGVPSFAALDADAVSSEVDGVPVRICSLAHLRAMKQAADRPIDRADLDALPSD